MYAIVEIAGHQYKVEKDQKIYVNRLEAHKEGASVDFDKVLLVDNDSKVSVGAPTVSGAKVTAKVLQHLKGDKVIVFKKKRRKGYKKKNGFRAYLTQLEISSIAASGAKAAAPKKEAAKKATDAKGDDLKKIEGVGPKIAEILAAAGLATFEAVSKVSADDIRKILEEAGGRYKSHDPETWPKQAELAANGKWDELKAWQDELDGGK